MQGAQHYASAFNLVENGTVIGSLKLQDGKIVIVGNTDIGKPSLIGGTSNSYYNDEWVENNLVNHPPAPGLTGPSGWTSIDVNVVRTNTEIGFWVKNPTQTVFGDILVPYINNIKIEIPAVNARPAIAILDSNTYLPSINPIEAVIISKIMATGYNSSYSYGSSGTRKTYVYSAPSELNINDYIVNGKINVNIWFENTANKDSPNILTVPLKAFLEALPPSIVRSVNASNITTISSKLNWTAPEFTSGDNNNSNITAYKIDYASTSSPNRYQYVSQSSSIPVGNTGNTQISSLIPGTNYIVSVSAKNNISNSFGPSGTTSFLTLNPPAPPIPTSITLTLPPSNFFPTIKSVETSSLISDPVYSYNTAGGNCSPLTNFPIHTTTTVGSTENNLMFFDFLINGVSQSKFNFNGFGSSPAYTTQTISGNKASFNVPTITDSGAGNNAYFYNIVSSITPYLMLNNETPLSAGIQHKGQLMYSVKTGPATGSSLTGTNKFFYIDDLNKTPFISGLTLTDSFLTKKITGINVVGASSSQNLNFSVLARNFARYFYHSDKIIVLNNKIANVTTTNNTLSSLPANTENPIPIDLDVEFSGNASVVFGNSGLSYGISYDATVFSPYTTSGSSATTLLSTINKLYDGLSYNKMIKSNITNTGNIGYRVLTQNPLRILPNPVDFNFGYTNYDNNASLLTFPYTQELPIIKGKYTTVLGNETYLDNCNTYGGINYSSIKNETNFRYLTYVWNVDMSQSATLMKLQFAFSGFNGNGKVIRNNAYSRIDTSDAWQVFYRFEQIDGSGNVVNPETETPSPKIYTSYWINANANGSSFYGFINKPSNNGIGGLLYSPADVSPINTPTSSSFTYNVLSNSIQPNSDSAKGLRIYLMVGMAMNSGISFNDVTCSFTN